MAFRAGKSPCRSFETPQRTGTLLYKEEHLAVVSLEHSRRAAQLLSKCPLHSQTPLRSFDQLAARLGVGRIFIKDESARLGLSSFKALGGAYAVMLRAPGSPFCEYPAANRRAGTAHLRHCNGWQPRNLRCRGRLADRESLGLLPSPPCRAPVRRRDATFRRQSHPHRWQLRRRSRRRWARLRSRTAGPWSPIRLRRPSMPSRATCLQDTESWSANACGSSMSSGIWMGSMP